jgi:Sulfotransferase family
MSRIRLMPFSGPYLLAISNEKRFVWFQVPKVGTRTIHGYLKKSSVRLEGDRPGFLYYSPNLYTGYLKFAFSRNPWDRLVSCWSDKVVNLNYFKFPDAELEKMRRFENFVEFVERQNIETCDRHLRLQSKLIDLVNVDYLGRLETFDDDFSYICRRLKLEPKTIERKNVSAQRRSYQEYYDRPLRDKVEGIYRKDIQTFGYKFSETRSDGQA